MSDQNTPLPPAGWYADPENAAGERWWNGAMWGEERRATAVVPAVPAVPVAPPVVAAGAVVDDRPNPYASTPYASTPQAAPYGEPTPATAPAYVAPYTGQPAAYGPAAPNPNPVALVGFIISMASILLNLVLTGLVGIAGGVVSAIGLAKANRLAAQGITPNGRGLALAGTIVGFVGGGLTILGYIALYGIVFLAGLY